MMNVTLTDVKEARETIKNIVKELTYLKVLNLAKNRSKCVL